MLFQLIDRVCSRIDGMTLNVEVPRFASELRRMRPSLKSDMKSKGIAKGEFDKAVLALSTAELMVIKALPKLAAEMATALQNEASDPSFRCVLAASLAYFVQPNDLLPDNLPGGYGFLDDALMLHEASALSWEATGNVGQAEERRKIFEFLYLVVPDGRREEFQSAVSGIAMTLNMMRMLDPLLAAITTQTLIANPLQSIAPPGGAPAFAGLSPMGQRFAGNRAPLMPEYTWQHGDTMVVNFPGGGGVAADSSGVYAL